MKNGKGKIILLLVISIISINKVNALSLYSGNIGTNQITGHDRAYNGFFMNDNLALNTDWTINYTLTNININNYDYFITHLYFNYYDDIYISTSTNEYEPVENTEYYCSSWVQKQETYADGTQSNYYECEIWSPSGTSQSYTTSSFSNSLINNKVQIQADLLMDDNYWSVCTIENDSNGVSTLTCPLNNNRTKINRLRIRYTSLHWGEGALTRASVGVSNVYNLYRDPVRDLITQENTNTQSIINNNNSNAQDIQDGINNSDYTGQTEQPDSTDFDSYEQKEQALEQLASADMTSVNVGLNANASNWIWNIFNRIINVNPVIMSFYITILSIGVIKLIMRR